MPVPITIGEFVCIILGVILIAGLLGYCFGRMHRE